MRGQISRRDFLKMSTLFLGSLSLRPWKKIFSQVDFPDYERLGRVLGGRVDVKAKPDIDSETVGVLFDDDIVPWLQEVVGKRPLWYNQRFVETPGGFVYAPNLQPVRNQLNTPVTKISQQIMR